MLKLYKTKGFTVTTLFMDQEFECMQILIDGPALNTTKAYHHVPDIERQLHVIKEHFHGVCSTLPFTSLPALMICKLMKFVVLWINTFPSVENCWNDVAHA